MIRETSDARKIAGRFDAEIRNVGAPFSVPTEAIIEAGKKIGDILLYDDLDDPRTDGRGMAGWITCEDWRTGRDLAFQHLWGPSRFADGRERHLEIMIAVCDFGIALDGDPRFRGWRQPFADTPIRYARNGHVITTIADQVSTVSSDGRYGLTTMRSARPLLIGLRP